MGSNVIRVIASVSLAFLLSLVATGSLRSQGVKVTTISPETIKTSTYFDSASQKLTITCDLATRGWCYFFVADEMRAKGFVVRSKTRAVIAGVSDKARVCAVGRNPGGTCNLTPVSS